MNSNGKHSFISHFGICFHIQLTRKIDLENPDDQQEVEKETNMLKLIWYFIRIGDIQKAVDICKEYHDYWRVSSIEGYYLSNYVISTDGSYEYTGNPHRSLWLTACHKICQQSGSHFIEEMERSIYTYLSGDSEMICSLSLIEDVQELLWFYLRCNMHIQTNIYYKDFQKISRNPLKDPLEGKMTIYGTIHSLKEIFEKIDINQKEKITKERKNSFFIIQKYILLHDYQGLFDYMKEQIESLSSLEDELSMATLRFYLLLIYFCISFSKDYCSATESLLETSEQKDNNTLHLRKEMIPQEYFEMMMMNYIKSLLLTKQVWLLLYWNIE